MSVSKTRKPGERANQCSVSQHLKYHPSIPLCSQLLHPTFTTTPSHPQRNSSIPLSTQHHPILNATPASHSHHNTIPSSRQLLHPTLNTTQFHLNATPVSHSQHSTIPSSTQFLHHTLTTIPSHPQGNSSIPLSAQYHPILNATPPSHSHHGTIPP